MNQSIVSILEWNINQRAGHRGIPPWVLDEVVAKDPDIIVLTEFCTECAGGNKFIEDLKVKDYKYYTSGNPQGNDVLIAVKKEYSVLGHDQVKCYDPMDSLRPPVILLHPNIPENLRVDINFGGRTLTVVGIRIRAFDLEEKMSKLKKKMPDLDKAGKNALKRKAYAEINILKRKEFLWALDWIKDVKNPIVMAGDFNNYRRGEEAHFEKYTEDFPEIENRWSIAQIDHMLPKGYMRITPRGSSIRKAAAEDPDFEFAEDHFIIKGIQGLTLFPYDRSFTKNHKEYYPPNENLKGIKAGFPDHAILRGEFTLPDPDSPADQ